MSTIHHSPYQRKLGRLDASERGSSSSSYRRRDGPSNVFSSDLHQTWEYIIQTLSSALHP